MTSFSPRRRRSPFGVEMNKSYSLSAARGVIDLIGRLPMRTSFLFKVLQTARTVHS
jgi:hypothetical protein